ncbi:hypothetical protein BS78_K246600 [Paspalum vaginatum]|uniref:SPX domain-containing protein n=1 Tax=Paspalum vaginatum TaxID=158149 RepID=A0A9W7X7J4_9POAL|nr:hypothetical protein BS78_K246600 [Paspalum vaginatum]
MKFGKDFRNHLEETLPAWRDKYLAYKALKKLIKNLGPHEPAAPPLPPPPPAAGGAGDGAGQGNVALGNWFATILDAELHKLNEFYIEREEWYVIRLQVLKERIERVKAKKNDAFTSKSEFTEEMLEIRKDFVIIHGEMILLQTYSSLNFAGLVKILKKYDKRTGGLLSLPFTQRVRHQPFFTTEPLTRLVRECEANLELLFPVEAEVLEPSSSSNMETHDVARHDPTSRDVETSDVYRSTLAAMKAIQGLRRASSTYNPLSLSRFFNGEDGEACSGAITSESSLSDSSTDSQIQDAEKDGKEVQSNPRQQNGARGEQNPEDEPTDE